MTSLHIVSDELLQDVHEAIARGEQWMAYNTSCYFLDRDDMFFFQSKSDAVQFSDNEFSDYDNFHVIHVSSVKDLFEHFSYENELIINKSTVMNEKNLQYLQDNLKYMGFGDKLDQDLQKNMAEGKTPFTLDFQTQFNKHEIRAVLHFSKSDKSDMYFFNKWEGKLLSEVGRTDQTFYLNKGQGITLKEGFNMLEGRAVHKELENKEGEKYQAWVQLDFTVRDPYGQHKVNQYHQNYGFDLEKVLSALPIKELTIPEQKETLMKSLEKGNVQAAIFEKDGFAEKLFIEAAPRFKSINVYDHTGHRLSLENLEKRFGIEVVKNPDNDVSVVGRAKLNEKAIDEAGGNEIKNELKTSTKKAKALDGADKNNKITKKDLTDAPSLLPKKRNAVRKGLHP